jgi:hypothetical protein
MSRLWDLNLIHFFDFYLATAFLLSTANRIRQYRIILALVRAFPGRWPRLLGLVKQHRAIFLTWATLAPAVLALALMVIQTLASQVLWPQSDLTLGRLLAHPLAVAVVGACGLAMLAVDVYFILVVSQVDRPAMEKYFDQAEYWLRSWAAPVVRVFTLGFVNPRQVVAVEVRTALVSASRLVNTTLWWVVLQTGLRIAYGVSLWGTYAWTVRG